VGSVTLTYTFTGSEPRVHDVPFVVWPIPNFSGNFTVTTTFSAPYAGTIWLHNWFGKNPPWQTCSQFQIIGGDLSYTNNGQVGNPGFAWGCLDFNAYGIAYDESGARATAGSTVTVVITADLLVPVCAYGTEAINSRVGAIEIGWGIIDALGLREKAPWAWPIIIGQIASPYAIHELCASLPPADPVVTDNDWRLDSPLPDVSLGEYKVLQKFQIGLWGLLCH
jgi:hypothetical protein